MDDIRWNLLRVGDNVKRVDRTEPERVEAVKLNDATGNVESITVAFAVLRQRDVE